MPGSRLRMETAERLPQDFLQLDTVRLHESARKVRSMSDLRSGANQLNADWMTASRVGPIASYSENGQDMYTQKCVNRGMVLGHILISDAALRVKDPSDSFAEMVSLQPGASAANQYSEVLFELRDGRITARREEMYDPHLEVERPAYRTFMSTILQKAGLYEAIDPALINLSGEGLDTPTDYDDAAYGISLVALAIAESNPHWSEDR